MRLFVALSPPPDVVDELRERVSTLRELEPDVRWSRPEQWHLTLAFLGEVGDESRDELSRRLGKAAGSVTGCCGRGCTVSATGSAGLPTRSVPPHVEAVSPSSSVRTARTSRSRVRRRRQSTFARWSTRSPRTRVGRGPRTRSTSCAAVSARDRAGPRCTSRSAAGRSMTSVPEPDLPEDRPRPDTMIV